jgi:hypothetical protein
MAPVVTWSARFRAVVERPRSNTATKASVKPLVLPSLGKQSENHPFLFLWCPVLAHQQQQKHCTVRNWVTEVDPRSTEWSRKYGNRKCIFCGKKWGLFLMASDWLVPIVCSLQHFSLASDPGPKWLEGILFLSECHNPMPVSSHSY